MGLGPWGALEQPPPRWAVAWSGCPAFCVSKASAEMARRDRLLGASAFEMQVHLPADAEGQTPHALHCWYRFGGRGWAS